MQGVHAEIRTLFAQSAHIYITASRIAQGQDDYNNASPEEREDIEVRWLSQKEQMKGFYSWKQKEKGKATDVSPTPPEHGSVIMDSIVSNEPKTGWLHTRHLPFEERKKLQEQKKLWRRKRDSIREETKEPICTSKVARCRCILDRCLLISALPGAHTAGRSLWWMIGPTFITDNAWETR